MNESRGASLEVIVSRMRALIAKEFPSKTIRYIVASATIPNPDDLSKWLIDKNGAFAECLKFNYSDRPVPLHEHVYTAPYESKNPFTFDLALNKMLPSIIRKHSSGKPTLIFCNTKKSAETTAESLLRDFSSPLPGVNARTEKLNRIEYELR